MWSSKSVRCFVVMEEKSPLVTDAHVVSRLEILASLRVDNEDQECHSVYLLQGHGVLC